MIEVRNVNMPLVGQPGIFEEGLSLTMRDVDWPLGQWTTTLGSMIVIYGDGTTFVVSPLSENSDSRFGCVKMKSVVRSELSVCAADLTDPRPQLRQILQICQLCGGRAC